MVAMAGQLAVRCQPDPLRVAQNPWGASRGVEREVHGGLEFFGGTAAPRRDVGTCVPFQLVTGIDVDCIRPGLVSWLRLAREKSSANRGPPARLDRTGPCADLRCTPHRRIQLRTLARGIETPLKVQHSASTSSRRWPPLATNPERRTTIRTPGQISGVLFFQADYCFATAQMTL